MSTTLRKMLVPLAAAVLLLTACGGSDQGAVEDDPQAALDQALENLADYEGVAIEISVESTPDSLAALSEGQLGEEQAQQILDSSVAMTAKEGGDDPADQQFEIVGNIAGQDRSVEMKVLGTTMYVRADVDGLAETFGADASQIAAFEQQYGSRPGFEFIGTLLDGDWVSLTGAEQFAEQMTGQPVEGPTEEQKAMADRLAKSLEGNSSVEAGDKEGPGGHLIVSLNVQDFYADFKSVAESAGGLATGGQPLPDPSEVPDEDLVLDVWVSDEQITQVELDVTQFADWEEAEDFPDGVDDLRLRVTVAEFTGEIEQPEAAAEVDFQELMGLFMGGAGAGESAEEAPPGGSDELCKEIEASLEGQPDEVIEQAQQLYGEMCPNL